MHVKGLGGLHRNQGIKLGNGAIRVVAARDPGRLFFVVRGQKGQQIFSLVKTILIVFDHEVGLAGFVGMSFDPAEFFQGNLHPGLGFNEGRPGNPHEAGLAVLKDKVLHDGVVGLAAQTGAHKQGDLGDNARS